jgi:TRAP-type uncharacterized transport system fused permease subunit
MGSAAFIMAEYTGIEYVDIAKAALLPALLYYVGVFSQVHFRAYRLGLGGLSSDQIPTFIATLRKGGLFIIPMRSWSGRCWPATRRPWSRYSARFR